MMSMDGHTDQFLRGLPFFKELSETDINALLSTALVREYKKQESICHLGDAADRFFIVVSGWVKLYRETNEGEEAIIGLLARGDIFGEASAIFNGAGYAFSAEASEISIIVEIPGNILRNRARMNHTIVDRVMAVMSKEMRNLQLENEHLALMSAPQRVGCLLLQLSAGMIGKCGTFSFPYDKSLAAARLGMKPETFSRALAQLKPVGVIVHGPTVKIENFSHLIDYCCGHCSSLPGECKGSRICSEKTVCPARK